MSKITGFTALAVLRDPASDPGARHSAQQVLLDAGWPQLAVQLAAGELERQFTCDHVFAPVTYRAAGPGALYRCQRCRAAAYGAHIHDTGQASAAERMPPGTEVCRLDASGGVVPEMDDCRYWIDRYQPGPHDVIIRREFPNSLGQVEVPWASSQLAPQR